MSGYHLKVYIEHFDIQAEATYQVLNDIMQF